MSSITSYRLPSAASSADSAFCTTSSFVEVVGPETDRLRRLEESEARRHLLLLKIKEAQHTITMQSQRITECERMVSEKTAENDFLKRQKLDNQRKLNKIEQEFKLINERLSDYLTIRDGLLKKIDSLDSDVESLQSANGVLLADCERKTEQLQQSTSVVSRLEGQLTQFNAERERCQHELQYLRESLEVAKSRNEQLDRQLTETRRDNDKLKQENHSLMLEIRTFQNQLTEARHLNSTHKEQLCSVNNQLLQTQSEQSTTLHQKDEIERLLNDTRLSMASVTADRDRLVQEKLQLHQQMQNKTLEYEQLLQVHSTNVKTEEELRTEVVELKDRIEQSKENERELTSELEAVQKVSETLSNQLMNIQKTLDSVTEQLELASLSNDSLMQQHAHYELEISALNARLLSKTKEVEELSADREHFREQAERVDDQMTSEIRQLKIERQEMEAELREANEKLEHSDRTIKSQFDGLRAEMEKWKNANDKQLATIRRKDLEMESLTKRIHELEDEIGFLKVNHNVYESQYAELTELRDHVIKLEDEKRRLLQERTENQQLIDLLEMQKNALLNLCQPPSDFTNTAETADTTTRLNETDCSTESLRNDNTVD